jgi:hypothetical protein
MTNLSPEKRFVIYRLVAAILTTLAAYNIVDAELVPVWAEVAGIVLGVGSSMLASFNVPKQ